MITAGAFAPLVQRVEIKPDTVGKLAFYDRVPQAYRDTLARTPGVVVYGAAGVAYSEDLHVISNVITTAMLSKKAGTWRLDGDRLEAPLAGGGDIVFFAKGTSRASLATWSSEVNAMRLILDSVRAPKAPTPKPTPH